jgi:two-component system sensor histidine kinase/response regulator
MPICTSNFDANTYLAKPIRADELFDTIAALFAAPGEAATSPATPQPKRDIADWPDALRAVRGDHRLLRTIVEAATKEIPRLMTAIREAVSGGKAAELQLAAHTLKGAIRYFASSPGFELVRRLEKMGHDNNLEGAQESLAALEAEVQTLTPALADYLQQNQVE